VMLQVKFATIDRSALSQLGVNLFSVNPKLVGTATTQQFQFPRIGQLQFQQGNQGPELGNQQVSISDLLNLFAFRPDLNFGATIKLLQAKNLLEILAEPNLITVSGKQASFLAGGEFPYPVISTTGTGGNAAPVVTIQFRKFGVQLIFTPTVDPATGVIHLRVAPEVSALDFANALTIQGFLIPAISSRSAETEVDLHENESFAIAGLIDNRVTNVVNKIPGIGSVPIIGRLFSSRSQEKSNTELLVVITPRFVKPFAAGEPSPMLEFPKGFLDEEKKKPEPAKAPAFSGPRGPEGGEKK
jgi:pilus assembly protein CpaC